MHKLGKGKQRVCQDAFSRRVKRWIFKIPGGGLLYSQATNKRCA